MIIKEQSTLHPITSLLLTNFLSKPRKSNEKTARDTPKLWNVFMYIMTSHLWCREIKHANVMILCIPTHKQFFKHSALKKKTNTCGVGDEKNVSPHKLSVQIFMKIFFIRRSTFWKKGPWRNLVFNSTNNRILQTL